MNRTLVVMRHAKSSWKTAEPDYRRPLSGRGTRDAVVAGQLLSALPLQVVLSSSATRTRQTWQCAAMGGASATEVHFTDDLYEADLHQAVDEVSSLDAAITTALLLGHNPTMQSLVLWLSQPSALTERVAAKFPTSAIATITFEADWAELDRGLGRLLRLDIPRG